MFAEARLLPTLDELTGELGARLDEAGARLWRLRLSLRTLHPLTTALSSMWERDSAEITNIAVPHGFESRPGYIGSPLQIIRETSASYRRKLSVNLTEDDHSVLHELKARGVTDYFGTPVRFSDDAGATLVFASDHEDGFSDGDIRQFEELTAYLTPIVEVFRLKSISLAVAEAYLGERTGRRVLDGQFTRGNIEKIKSAILVSDIRNWTGINNRLPAEEALALANLYFEISAEAIEAHDGEILKFIGDGYLATFPSSEGKKEDALACRRALSAAQDALKNATERRAELPLRFGLGLHFGDVHYGNIGSQTRLDFTVMGQAVNTASRIESLCSRFEQELLFSSEFAERLDVETTIVGEELLKGDEEKRAIHTLV